MRQPSPEALAAFEALVYFARIGMALCEMAGAGKFRNAIPPQVICTDIGIPQTRAADVEEVLEAGRKVGLFSKVSATTWRAMNESLAAQITPLLEGVYLYCEHIHRDDNVVDVVLTKPPKPSAMAEALDATLEGSWGIQDTKDLLPTIAESARDSFTIMSPFMDEVGAAIVLNLFERAHVSNRYLILRSESSGKLPPGLAPIQERLATLGVTVLDFRLPRPEGKGSETFHAKVVLADGESAYLGSSNMLKSSFEHSLEMGLYVRGRAAARISSVLAAIRKVSTTMV